MTFEDVLGEPGRKARTSGDDEGGQRMVSIFILSSRGAKELATKQVPVAEHDAVVADLEARGCELAQTESLTRIVWVINADGVEVFDKRRKQLHAAGDRATLEDGRIVDRSAMAEVSAWASDEYAHRGIKATLRSGKDIELVTEISLDATGDPTYNRNDLLFDSGWCITLGRVIASWAGTTFADKI